LLSEAQCAERRGVDGGIIDCSTGLGEVVELDEICIVLRGQVAAPVGGANVGVAWVDWVPKWVLARGLGSVNVEAGGGEGVATVAA